MKSIFIQIFIAQFILLVPCLAQDQKKPIKTVTTAEYSPQRSGELTREEAFKQNKSSFQKLDNQNRVFQYDQFGPSSKRIYKSYRYLDFSDLVATRVEIYDDQNNLIEYEVITLNSDEEIESIYSYDRLNKLTGIEYYNYDEDKNMASRIDSSFKYSRTLKWSYEYNANNKMSVRRAYDKTGALRDTRTYKYNSDGKESECELTRANGDFSSYKSTYNKNGDYTDSHSYDEKGLLTNHTKFDYIYDEHGNWTTKHRLSDGVKNYTWERQIEYY